MRDGGRNRIALRLVKKCMHKCHRGGRQESLATNEGGGEYKGEKPRGRDVKRRKRKGSVRNECTGRENERDSGADKIKMAPILRG